MNTKRSRRYPYSRFFEAVPGTTPPPGVAGLAGPAAMEYDPSSHGIASRRPVDLSWHPENIRDMDGPHGDEQWDIHKHGVHGPDIDPAFAVHDESDEAKNEVKSAMRKLLERTRGFSEFLSRGAAHLAELGRENIHWAPLMIPYHIVKHGFSTLLAFIKGFSKFLLMIANLAVHSTYYGLSCFLPGVATGKLSGMRSDRCKITGHYILDLLGQFKRAPVYFTTFGVVTPFFGEKALMALVGTLHDAGLFDIDPHDHYFHMAVIAAFSLYKWVGNYLHDLDHAIEHAIHEKEKELEAKGDDAGLNYNNWWYSWHKNLAANAPEIFSGGYASLLSSPIVTDIIGVIKSAAAKVRSKDAAGENGQAAAAEQAAATARQELSGGIREAGIYSGWLLTSHPEFIACPCR